MLTHVARIRGFCYQHIGMLLQDAEGLTQAVRDLYKKGSSEYAATQKYYPPDDQYSICQSSMHGYRGREH